MLSFILASSVRAIATAFPLFLSSPDTVLATATPVEIHFAAKVGSAPFVCGREYAGLGVSRAAASASEFMLYVTAVRLLRADGTEVPVALTADGTWQRDNTALIDFAGGGVGTDCTNASPDTNTVLRGTIAAPGEFTGIRFVLGVPFAQNHQDQATAESPFSSSRMFWSWNGGYKFVRLDLAAAAHKGGWFVHLGSVGCTPAGGPAIVPTSCREPNAPTITLTGFDPLRSPIIADAALLVAHSDLTATRGCMSNRASPGCPGVLRGFGVMPDASGSVAQHFFRIER
jgi:uncharacterized repeat protein (TIGR04052 family)